MVFNETAILAAPIFSPIVKIFTVLQGLLGGLFGMYLLLVILKWKESRKLIRIMNDIRTEVKEINEKLSSKMKPAKRSAAKTKTTKKK